MAIQLINLGGTANDGNGEGLRTGGEKINNNFIDLSGRTDSLEVDVPLISADTVTNTTNLSTHTGDTVIHVTQEDRNKWDATSGEGITGHTQLLEIGINTHDEIDTHLSGTSNPHSVTASQVGLGSVDNTADADKPISNPTFIALNLKTDNTLFDSHTGDTVVHVTQEEKDGWDDGGSQVEFEAHTGDTTNPHVVTQTQVGLSNVDNTSDADKPVSTATQTALDGKVDDSQVLTNVPSGATFTDTIYDDTTIQGEVDLNTAKATNIAHPLVETAVPSGALFTDTVYDDTAIQAEVDLNTAKTGITETQANEIIANNAKLTNVAHPLVETAVPSGALFTDTVYDDTTIQGEVDSNTTHKTSDGSDHSFINQDVTSTATPTHANIISSNNATQNSHLVRLDQMNSALASLDWQESIIDQRSFVANEPAGPSEADRYLNTFTGVGSISGGITFNADSIYEWISGAWVEFVPNKGWTLWDEETDTNITYNGVSWVEFGSTISHNNTTGLQGGTATEYYHLTLAQHGNISNWDTAYSWGDHAGLYSLVGHNHTGVYEPADATILKDVDLGVTVQAFDANIVSDATYVSTENDFTNIYKAEVDANTLKVGVSGSELVSGDIGVTVQGYNVNTTIQGNTFNGNSQLVKLEADGKYPALDGSLITNLPAAGAISLPELTDVVSATNTNKFVLVANGTTGFVARALLSADLSDIEATISSNSDVAANTSKTGITAQQATDITTNNAKVGVTNEEENTINSIVAGEPTGSDVVDNVISLTQAEYDAGTPNATTQYLITDAANGGASQLDELSDVVSATNTNKFALMANGTTGYVGRALVAADVSDIESTISANSDVVANTAKLSATGTELETADLGVSVQAYDSNIVSDASYVATANDYTTVDKNKVGFISVTQAVDLDTMESDISTNNAKVTEKVPSTATGTEIDLSNYVGHYMNMSSANATTTYTTTGSVVGGNAVIRINAGSEPVITGGTKIKGSDFIVSTDMHMVVQYFGVTVQFFFVEL